MDNLWQKFEADFNAMSDKAIDNECDRCQDLIDAYEEWLEAAAFHKATGKPRKELEA